MKKFLFVTILLIPLMLIAPQFGFGHFEGPPPGADERLVGPAIDGVLGIIPDGVGSIGIAFIGFCNNQPVEIEIPSYGFTGNLSEIKKDDLLYQRLNVTGPVCNYYKPGAQYIIVNVKKFLNTETQVIAEVTIMFVEPKHK